MSPWKFLTSVKVFQPPPPNHNLVICVFLCYKQFTCFNYRFQLALCTFSLPLIDCYDYFSFNFTTLDRISPLGGRMYPDYNFVSITKPSEHLLSIQWFFWKKAKEHNNNKSIIVPFPLHVDVGLPLTSGAYVVCDAVVQYSVVLGSVSVYQVAVWQTP